MGSAAFPADHPLSSFLWVRPKLGDVWDVTFSHPVTSTLAQCFPGIPPLAKFREAQGAAATAHTPVSRGKSRAGRGRAQPPCAREQVGDGALTTIP